MTRRWFNLTPFDVPQSTPFHGLLFTITIDPNAAYGIYAGSFEVLALDAAGALVVNDVDPNVGNFSAAVPEPASMLLLGTGLSGLAGTSSPQTAKANQLERSHSVAIILVTLIGRNNVGTFRPQKSTRRKLAALRGATHECEKSFY